MQEDLDVLVVVRSFFGTVSALTLSGTNSLHSSSMFNWSVCLCFRSLLVALRSIGSSSRLRIPARRAFRNGWGTADWVPCWGKMWPAKCEGAPGGAYLGESVGLLPKLSCKPDEEDV